MRTRVISAVALGMTGLAIWLQLGALAVAGSEVSSRIAILPAGAWSAVIAVVVLATLGWMRPSVHTFPLLCSAILCLPWIPLPIPAAFLLWTGRLRSLVWIGIAVGLGATWRIDERLKKLRVLHDPRRAPLVAAALSLLLFLIAAGALASKLPAGDEPHYLIVTQSLVRDGDLRIENNHTRRDYLQYIDGDLKPDYLRRGEDGAIYSIHAPGLSVLIAPAFLLAGYPGVVIFLAGVSAFAAFLVWTLAYQVTGDTAAAWFGWASVTLSVPFLLLSFAVFPDAPGAAVVLIGLYAIVNAHRATRWRLMGYGAAVALLPWLHTRLALVAAVLSGVIALRLLRRQTRAGDVIAFLVFPGVSVISWLMFFQMIYGTPNPSAPYGGYTQTSLEYLPTGIAGLVLDQQFGVLPNAPVFTLAVVGLWFMMGLRRSARSAGTRDERRLALELFAIVVPYAMAAASYRMWWGGESAPARFVVGVLLPLGVPIAIVWARARPAMRACALALVVITLFLTGARIGTSRDGFLYDDRDGRAQVVERLTPSVDLSALLPTLFTDTPSMAVAVAAIWLAAFAAVWWIAHGLRQRAPTRAVLALSTGSGVLIAIMLAATAMWQFRGTPSLTPLRSQIAWLETYDAGGRSRGMLFIPFGFVGSEVVVAQVDLRGASDGAEPSLDRQIQSVPFTTGNAHLLDNRAWAETNGFWVPGAAEARFVFQPVQSSDPVRLVVRNVPRANRIEVVTPGWSQSFDLAPREERVIDVPRIPGAKALLVHVRSASGVRPVDVDPASTDTRLLGCWIEIR